MSVNIFTFAKGKVFKGAALNRHTIDGFEFPIIGETTGFPESSYPFFVPVAHEDQKRIHKGFLETIKSAAFPIINGADWTANANFLLIKGENPPTEFREMTKFPCGWGTPEWETIPMRKEDPIIAMGKRFVLILMGSGETLSFQRDGKILFIFLYGDTLKVCRHIERLYLYKQ